MNIRDMKDIDLHGKVVLIREDFNVPLSHPHDSQDAIQITSDVRLHAAIPTIKLALEKGAKQVLLMSHLGRPEEGLFDPANSLGLVAVRLSEILKVEVPLISDWLVKTKKELKSESKVALLENVRFHVGEKSNDPVLSQQMAELCDVFVMDAFATAHRAEASTCGITEFAPIACAGPLLLKELKAISKAIENPKKPVVVIVGGSKISTKLSLLGAIIDFADTVVIGGGMANTFLEALGHPIGKSIHEEELLDEANSLMIHAKEKGCEIFLPTDVMVSTKANGLEPHNDCRVEYVGEDEMILDIGADTAQKLRHVIQGAGTIIWNGPIGLFEVDIFGRGTHILAKEIAHSSAYSLAGGGDTIAAIEKYGLSEEIDYISTGGGAFLEMLEGKKLPAVKALELRAKTHA